jgi:hypothetical protein
MKRSFFGLATAATLCITTVPGRADPIDDRSIIAFTSEPNDLGSAKNFFTLFPRKRCQQDLLDEKHFLYFCSGRKDIQKFYFDLSYDAHTLVLSSASLHGEKPNLGKTLQELLKIMEVVGE